MTSHDGIMTENDNLLSFAMPVLSRDCGLHDGKDGKFPLTFIFFIKIKKIINLVKKTCHFSHLPAMPCQYWGRRIDNLSLTVINLSFSVTPMRSHLASILVLQTAWDFGCRKIQRKRERN